MINNHPIVKSTNAYLPNFLSTNVRSVFSKIDEFALLLKHLCIEIAAVYETWLHHGIQNDVLSIPNYNLIRHDRSVGCGGGVCVFVSNSFPYKRWTDLENPLYECLWLCLMPHRLEMISSHKLLGLQIQNDLKWNEHVDTITKKAARRLYIIRTLKRSGVPEEDLIRI